MGDSSWDREKLQAGRGPEFGESARVGRRRMLGMLASGAALAGMGPAAAMAEGGAGVGQPGRMAEVSAPEELFEDARLRGYKARRSSSWDRSGGNDDAVPIEAGKSATLLEVTGAGVITHIWFTISSADPHHLKNLVLRAWWDGESTPSIEVPVGDFFGLGLAEYYAYQSALVAVASAKALNAYFKMPFANGARVTVTNDGAVKTDSFYFAIDYVTLPSLPADLGRFHAQYRQANPLTSKINDWSNEYDPKVNGLKNLDGKDNYVFLEATGRGHFVGLTHALVQNQEGWFGEGDDMIFIDGDTQPTINGTGAEDYYNGAWGFEDKPFAYWHNGAPYMVDPQRIGGRYCLYRWHIESPITFEKSIRVTMEHGHANHRSDDYFSTAYWYQTEPHGEFPALPAANARVPRVYAEGGAGAAPIPGVG